MASSFLFCISVALFCLTKLSEAQTVECNAGEATALTAGTPITFANGDIPICLVQVDVPAGVAVTVTCDPFDLECDDGLQIDGAPGGSMTFCDGDGGTAFTEQNYAAAEDPYTISLVATQITGNDGLSCTISSPTPLECSEDAVDLEAGMSVSITTTDLCTYTLNVPDNVPVEVSCNTGDLECDATPTILFVTATDTDGLNSGFCDANVLDDPLTFDAQDAYMISLRYFFIGEDPNELMCTITTGEATDGGGGGGGDGGAASCDAAVELAVGTVVTYTSAAANVDCESEITVPAGVGVNIQCDPFDVTCQDGESMAIVRDRVVGTGTSLIDSRILCDGFAQLAFPVTGVLFPPITSTAYTLNLINRASTGSFECTVTGTET